MPTWEIIEWSENNFDLSQNSFAQEAFNRRRYAFVTDYVRLKVLYDHGGVYMDSDVEVLRPLDKFLEHKAFSGHETKDLLVTATMGSIPKHSWIELLLKYYDNRTYSENTNTNIITQLSKPLIVRENQYGYRWLQDDVWIYPVETFCPYDHVNLRPLPTNNTYAMHLFAGTWKGRTKVKL